MKFAALIIENNPHFNGLIAMHLQHHPLIGIEGIARSGLEAHNFLLKHKIDLIIIEMNYPDLNCLCFFEKLDYKPKLIFITASDNFAAKAFELGAIDYLLKPFSAERFNQAIDKFIISRGINPFRNNIPKDIFFSFKENRKQFFVAYKNIIYLSSHGKHTIIHTQERTFESAELLKNIEMKLPQNIFLRIHRQYITNIQFIIRIKHYCGGQYTAYINDMGSSTLPVGRLYVPVLKDRLKLSV